MSLETTLTGHASVGFTSARGSIAQLIVSKDRLVVRCIRRYAFRPDQVVALIPDGHPFLSRGFRVIHNRPDVAGSVYFSCSGGHQAIQAALDQVGFRPTGAPFKGWRRPGPMRTVFIAMAIVSAILLLRQYLDRPDQSGDARDHTSGSAINDLGYSSKSVADQR